MNCINCGKPSNSFVCDTCIRVGKEQENLIRKGFEIEYQDGTRRTVKTPDKK